MGIERKWRLMLSPEVESEPGLQQRVMVTFAGRFVDDAFIWELRSKTDLVPFSALIAGDLDVVPVPCLEVSPDWFPPHMRCLPSSAPSGSPDEASKIRVAPPYHAP